MDPNAITRTTVPINPAEPGSAAALFDQHPSRKHTGEV